MSDLNSNSKHLLMNGNGLDDDDIDEVLSL